ncbi:MAG: type II secretion system protein GspG [Planctomycetota bacterium]
MAQRLHPSSVLLGALATAAGFLSLAAASQQRPDSAPPVEIGQSLSVMRPTSTTGKVVAVRGQWVQLVSDNAREGAWFNFDHVTAFTSFDSSQGGESSVARAKMHVLAIEEAVRSYAVQNQMRYPESLQELVIPDRAGFTFLAEAATLTDPWGNSYSYERPGTAGKTFRILCYGADGKPGGKGEAMDFDNLMIRSGEF